MFDSLKAMAIHEQQKGIPLNADSSACSSNFSCEYCSEGKRLAIPILIVTMPVLFFSWGMANEVIICLIC